MRLVTISKCPLSLTLYHCPFNIALTTHSTFYPLMQNICRLNLSIWKRYRLVFIFTSKLVAERISARHLILQHALGQCIVYLSGTLFCACARGGVTRVYVFVVRWMDGRGETSRSTPAYSEPWMRRERINVSVHSIYAIVCRSPRQTKRLGLHLIILTQCYLLHEAYVCALCVYLVLQHELGQCIYLSVTLFYACARGGVTRVYVFVVDGRGETSRSTPVYSEPWMRRERINVSVHSIYAIVCRSPRARSLAKPHPSARSRVWLRQTSLHARPNAWAFAVYPILSIFYAPSILSISHNVIYCARHMSAHSVCI